MMDVIIAKTHTSDYLLHKYWARKPHNVLSQLIADLVTHKNGIVLDPFCGSGVFLRESLKLGHKAYGFDVNPVAAILSDVTCNPPDDQVFRTAIEPLLEKFETLCNRFYQTSTGVGIRYYVHETIVKCPKCETRQTKAQSNQDKTKNTCNKCGEKLSFSLSSLVGTEITSIVTDNGVLSTPKELLFGKKLETSKTIKPKNLYDQNFEPNKRILSFGGMTTKDLFTERNFYLLSTFADWLHEIKDESIKKASLLLLTASVAQCSRLIAYRNNLTTGGPAWSVPGFWVPAQHLETNPHNHIVARYKKFTKGLESLYKVKTTRAIITNDDCINLNKALKGKVDLIFLDPPYGDSVPYMEFSMIWNSFLGKAVDVTRDISVSDRNQKKIESWSNYREALKARIKLFKNVLAENGKLLITFNNHDYRAWEALIEALQQSKMSCVSTIYQIPAVVSSKAQFSKDGSYISDIYSIYVYDPNLKPLENLDSLERDLIKAGQARKGKITRSVLYRAAFVSILKNNISYIQLQNLEKLIDKLFLIENNLCVLKKEFFGKYKVKSIEQIASEELDTFLAKGSSLWDDYYSHIASKTRDIGIPEPSEIMEHLKASITVEDGMIVPLIKSKKSEQMKLFA